MHGRGNRSRTATPSRIGSSPSEHAQSQGTTPAANVGGCLQQRTARRSGCGNANPTATANPSKCNLACCATSAICLTPHSPQASCRSQHLQQRNSQSHRRHLARHSRQMISQSPSEAGTCRTATGERAARPQLELGTKTALAIHSKTIVREAETAHGTAGRTTPGTATSGTAMTAGGGTITRGSRAHPDWHDSTESAPHVDVQRAGWQWSFQLDETILHSKGGATPLPQQEIRKFLCAIMHRNALQPYAPRMQLLYQRPGQRQRIRPPLQLLQTTAKVAQSTA